VEFNEAGPQRYPEREGRAGGVALLVGIVAAVVAGATIWLMFTDPVTVANAVGQGEITPLVRQLGLVIFSALVSLFSYF
jgi:Mg/Co/Ni transporter MgtE